MCCSGKDREAYFSAFPEGGGLYCSQMKKKYVGSTGGENRAEGNRKKKNQNFTVGEEETCTVMTEEKR